jgi:hypothetical protein
MVKLQTKLRNINVNEPLIFYFILIFMMKTNVPLILEHTS